MKKVTLIAITMLLVVCVASITSCKNKATTKEKKAKIEKESEEIETIKKKIEENVYPLPTSAEVVKMLTDLEVGYMIGITNPASNAKKYIKSDKKALNLGVYGADLSYVTLYNIQDKVQEYLEALRLLANDLNMGRIYDVRLYDSIKIYFDDRDRLVKLLTNAFNETYQYLSENEQQNLALLVVGGAWVEGLYLTTHVSEEAYHVAGISKAILEQKKSFELYLDITQPYADDPMIKDFLKLLEPMKKIYERLSTSLTEQDIKDITAAITLIREKII
ncbi:MAG TPA: hypothetical protein PLN06_06440 [Bacteroidales bacterium]|nr:hypothetical protein [Bacteroidales bacterium]HCI55727.1 hypothetical protein [Bacteroidales bacterium]HOU96249.1 hypothetical protein [Bacteroidales bacterium]HQG36824.1 hypothetical protein [Bacteroidales bacterium]HQG53064.1 hypothetical protein [Bacteroidales bacterium]